MTTNYSSSHTQAHLSGPVTSERKFYDAAASATHEPYGTINIRSGQVGFTFFILNSETAQAIAAEFVALANDLAIEEVTQANLRDEQAAAEQAAADERERAEGVPGHTVSSLDREAFRAAFNDAPADTPTRYADPF